MLVPQTTEYIAEAAMFLLHLLVVAPALLGLPAAHEQRHRFEDLISASHVFVEKMLVVYFEEPMVPLVFL